VWLEDDELMKDGGGVGSAAVFPIQVALVSRRLAVVVLPLLYCVLRGFFPVMVLLLLAVLMKGNGSGSRIEAPFFFSLLRSWLLPFLQWCCSGMGEAEKKTTIPGSVRVFVFPSLCFKASPFSPLLFFYFVSSLSNLSQWLSLFQTSFPFQFQKSPLSSQKSSSSSPLSQRAVFIG
jgi:hypothetical protein